MSVLLLLTWCRRFCQYYFLLALGFFNIIVTEIAVIDSAGCAVTMNTSDDLT